MTKRRYFKGFDLSAVAESMKNTFFDLSTAVERVNNTFLRLSTVVEKVNNTFFVLSTAVETQKIHFWGFQPWLKGKIINNK